MPGESRVALGGPLFRTGDRPYSEIVKHPLLVLWAARVGLAFFVLLAACGVPQPTNVEVDPPAGADDAAEIVVQEWSERLGVELDVEDLPPVRWFEGPCLDYGDGCISDGGYARSFDGAAEIHVLWLGSIHGSALSHEALHWSLDMALEDRDPDHGRARWSEEPAVQAVLASAGL